MKVDPHSDTWLLVSEAAAELILQAQTAIERRNTTLTDTEFERGRLSAARDILSLVAPPKARPQIPTPYTY